MIHIIVGSDWFDYYRPRLLSGSSLDRLKARCLDDLYRIIFTGPSIVVSMHDMIPRLKRAYGIAANNLASFGPHIESFSVLGDNAIDNNSIGRSNKNIILFMGRLSSEKGLETLIRSMKLVARSKPEASLVILGDGPLRGELRGMIDSLGLEKRVQLLGHVPHDDLPKHLKSATMVAIPYVWAAGPTRVLLEALAWGVPAIATEFNYSITHLAAKKCVLAVPPKDESAMADAILRLLNDIELRQTLAQNGRRYIEDYLSAQHVADMWKSTIGRARRFLQPRQH
jgi:glycosyltransferase involved in cell wall biosynthesis